MKIQQKESEEKKEQQCHNFMQRLVYFHLIIFTCVTWTQSVLKISTYALGDDLPLNLARRPPILVG